MALPITVPFTFGNATTTQSLSSLDADFSTVYNAVNGIGNGTVSLSNVSITGGTVSANITSSSISSGTSNVSITSTSGPVSINTNGTNAVYIDASQNVGIGVTPSTSTVKMLQLSGSGVFCTAADGLNAASNAYYNAAWKYASTGAATLYSQTAGLHIWYTNPSGSAGATFTPAEAMRIDTSGNLLMNRTVNLSPIPGKIAISYLGSAGFGIGIQDTSGGATNYGIVFVSSAGTTVGNISSTSSATAYNTASDYRLKNSIAPMESGLTTVAALKPVTYKWNVDDSSGEGFIAHELQEVIPHAVTGGKDAIDEDGNPIHQGVDYSKIVVHLVAAIKELSAKNDALEARLVALESK